MGYDTHTVYIIFGIKIREEDSDRVIKIFFPDKDEGFKRRLQIPNTTYHITSHYNLIFISLTSERIGVGEYEHCGGPLEIIPPTEQQIDSFLDYLGQHDIIYPYGQYFIP